MVKTYFRRRRSAAGRGVASGTPATDLPTEAATDLPDAEWLTPVVC